MPDSELAHSSLLRWAPVRWVQQEQPDGLPWREGRRAGHGKRNTRPLLLAQLRHEARDSAVRARIPECHDLPPAPLAVARSLPPSPQEIAGL